MGELSPGTDGPKPDEDSQVEQHVDRWLEGVVHCLDSEPVTASLVSVYLSAGIDKLMGECVSSYETSKQIIGANQTTGTHDEKLKRSASSTPVLETEILHRAKSQKQESFPCRHTASPPPNEATS